MSSLLGSRVLNSLKRASLAWKPLHPRWISTSEKKRDTATVTSEVESAAVCETKPKNWVSYGFSEKDLDEDRHVTHMTMFLGISLLFVVGGFMLAYRPDTLGRDWSQREAFLELRRREKLGLPLIDPNYLSLDKIILPTDEDLGNVEIVI